MTGTRFVLLHGLAGSVAGWREVAGRLAPHGTVSAPELPWNGTAGSAWGHGAGQHETVAGSYEDGDVVVAHSYAATLLLGLLSRGEGPTPRAVVLVSPFFRPEPRAFDWATMAHFMGDFHLLLAEGVRAASRRPIAEDLLHDMAVSVRDRIGPYGWVRFFDTYLATATWDVGRVEVPVGLVHGEDDEVAPPQGAHDLHARLPSATLRTLPGAGHFPMLLAPAGLAAEVLRTAARSDPAGPLPAPPVQSAQPSRPTEPARPTQPARPTHPARPTQEVPA